MPEYDDTKPNALALKISYDSVEAEANPEFAMQIKQALSLDPDNFELRCKLVGAYFLQPDNSDKIDNLIWFVERFSKANFMASAPFCAAYVGIQTDRLIEAWEKKMHEDPECVETFVNFVYSCPDHRRAAGVLKILRKRFPSHFRVKRLVNFLKATGYPPGYPPGLP